MDLIEAIKTRRSIRAYRPDPVPREVLEAILETSRFAGSPGNMQPWEFAVLGGEKMEEFRKFLVAQSEAKAPSELEFRSPLEVPEAYIKRRTEYYRENFDRYMYPPGTPDAEEQKRAHYARGAYLFGAPNAVIIYTDPDMITIPWCIMSLGIIAQTFCLAAREYGLGTCVMGRPVDWPNKLREMLGIPRNKALVCGITIGYPDMEARVNTIPPARLPLAEWVTWHGF